MERIKETLIARAELTPLPFGKSDIKAIVRTLTMGIRDFEGSLDPGERDLVIDNRQREKVTDGIKRVNLGDATAPAPRREALKNSALSKVGAMGSTTACCQSSNSS